MPKGERKIVRNKFVALAFALFLFAAGTSTGYSAPQPQRSAADQEKIEALNEAYRNGLLTQAEYDAKLKVLNAAAASPSAGNGRSEAAPAPADFGTMKTVDLIDPMFNMVAYTVTIPANWRYEGTVLHGPGCDGNEYAGRALR